MAYTLCEDHTPQVAKDRNVHVRFVPTLIGRDPMVFPGGGNAPVAALCGAYGRFVDHPIPLVQDAPLERYCPDCHRLYAKTKETP